MRRRTMFIGLLALAAIPMMGCGGGSNSTNNTASSKVIGPAGGQITLVSAQARVGVIFNQGSVPAATRFTVAPATVFPPDARIVPATVVTITPDFTFTTPATLTLGFDKTQVPAGKNPALCKAVNNSWVKVPNSTLDTTNSVFSAPIPDTNGTNAFGILAL